MEVQTQRIRRHLYFWALLCAQDEGYRGAFSTRARVWKFISDTAMTLGKGSSVTVGLVRCGHTWCQSQNDSKYPGLLAAAEQFAAFTNRVQPVAAKLSHAVQMLPAVSGYSQVTTFVWRPSSTYVRTVTGDPDVYGRIRLSREFPDWDQLFSLQLFSSMETDVENEVNAAIDQGGTTAGEAEVEPSADQLSTIP